MWDKTFMDMIDNKMWTDPRDGSGRLVNPGKKKFCPWVRTWFLLSGNSGIKTVLCAKERHWFNVECP